MPEPSSPAAALRDEILTRLDQADPGGGQAWPLLVLGALEGQQSLDAALAQPGARPTTAAPPTSATPSGPPRVAYLRSISAEGFRGIGARQTLELVPGPGLTLVVGRNGSGKSSFAEALELLLTGDTWRWSSARRSGATAGATSTTPAPPSPASWPSRATARAARSRASGPTTASWPRGSRTCRCAASPAPTCRPWAGRPRCRATAPSSPTTSWAR